MPATDNARNQLLLRVPKLGAGVCVDATQILESVAGQTVEITEEPSLTEPARQYARTVIFGSASAQQPPPNGPGTLLYRSKSPDIDPDHAALTLADGKWILRSRGKGVIALDGDKCEDVPPGAEWRFNHSEFAIRIRSVKFRIKSAPIGSIVPGPSQAPAKAVPIGFTIATQSFFLIVPESFPLGFVIVPLLTALWERLAQAIQIDPVPQLKIPDRGAGVDTLDPVAFQVKLGNDTFGFTLQVPRAFYRMLLDKMEAPLAGYQTTQAIRGIVWRRQFCLSEQELTMGQLRELDGHKIVILRRDSASMIDLDVRRAWKLERSDGPLFSKNSLFVVGREISDEVIAGGLMRDKLTIEDVPVKLQVVCSREVQLKDIQKYAPGARVELAIEEGAEVAIAINGMQLGKGNLIRVDEHTMGVQVLYWNV